MLNKKEILREYRIAKDSGIEGIDKIGTKIIKYHMDECLANGQFDDMVCFVMDTIMFQELDELRSSRDNTNAKSKFDRSMEIVE